MKKYIYTIVMKMYQMYQILKMVRKYFRSLKHFAETPRVHFFYDVVSCLIIYNHN